jgi:dTDP-4-dehydrorhamnose reductase
MRVLVTGAKGMLGTDLCAVLAARGMAPIGIDIDEADLTDAAKTLRVIRDASPSVVVHAAAYTRVDDAEKNPGLAFRVNAEGSRNVAAAAATAEAPLIAISTDYVYDGAKRSSYVETDPVGPLGAYGKSKLAGENEIVAVWPRHVILRTEWLYGVNGPNFVKTILRLAGEKPHLEVVADQMGAPTYTMDLADGISRIAEQLVSAGAEKYGVYHIAAGGACSWHEYATRIMSLAGKAIEVRPITSDKLARAAPRPANSALDCSKLDRAFGVRLPHWEDALRRYLAASGMLRE